VKALTVPPALTDAAAARLEGKLLGDDAYDILLGAESTTVRTPAGDLLLVYVKGAVPVALARTAARALRGAATPTDNRMQAAGDPGFGEVPTGAVRSGRVMRNNILKDGTQSRTDRSKAVHSGIVGYFDRTTRHPFCRQTAFNQQHLQRFKTALPFIQAVNGVFCRAAPDHWRVQGGKAFQTPPDWIIPSTVFSTVTVNKNWQTAVHKDHGDLPDGLGVMAAVPAGNYRGCYLCWPQYKVAVDLQAGDVVLGDVHEWHGNTPFHGVPGTYERVSFVFYLRERMPECLPAREELQRVQNRQVGDPIQANVPGYRAEPRP